jgi:spectinomycin phosphotransferase
VRYEPAIDRAALVRVLRSEFGIQPASLEFLPVGDAAACYKADADFLVKVWPDLGAGRASVVRPDVTMPLLAELRGRGLHVPEPVASLDGRLWAHVDGDPMVVLRYIHGSPARSWSAAMIEALAAIHRTTPTVALPVEQFEVPFESDLIAGMTSLELSGIAEVREELERLHAFHAGASPGAVVLCHTDFGRGNTIIDESGTMWILDWDDAVLSPVENDLKSVPPEWLPEHLGLGAVREVSRDRLGFFLLRRCLEDAAARVARLLDPRVPVTEHRDLIDGIRTWGFEQWRSVDSRLASFDRALAGSR